LSEYYENETLALVFLNSFGCPFCVDKLMFLQNDYGAYRKAGANIVCITQSSYKTARAFQILYGLSFDILSTNNSPALHRSYGLTQAKLSQVLNRNVLRSMIEYARHGLFPKLMGSLISRFDLPGAFIIGTDGRVLSRHIADDLVSVIKSADLLDELNRLASKRRAAA
jgi:hypothetical protein